MKDFNLQEALTGKPFCDQDENRYDEIHHAKTAKNEWLRVITVRNGVFNYWREDGTGLFPGEHLYMAEEPREWFVNVYEEGIGGEWKSYESASNDGVKDGRVGLVKITVQDGKVTRAEVVS